MIDLGRVLRGKLRICWRRGLAPGSDPGFREYKSVGDAARCEAVVWRACTRIGTHQSLAGHHKTVPSVRRQWKRTLTIAASRVGVRRPYRTNSSAPGPVQRCPILYRSNPGKLPPADYAINHPVFHSLLRLHNVVAI